MEALLQAMARAVTRMPRLRQFSAGTWFYDHDRGYGVNFEFFYLRAEEQQVVCDAQFEHDDVMKQRLFWNVPELWRMSDAVERFGGKHWDKTASLSTKNGMTSASYQEHAIYLRPKYSKTLKNL